MVEISHIKHSYACIITAGIGFVEQCSDKWKLINEIN